VNEVSDEQKARIVSILQDCEEYFDNLADAWTEDGYWVQNEENRLLNEVSAALDILGYKERSDEKGGK
jgi:PAS domain-containing protein